MRKLMLCVVVLAGFVALAVGPGATAGDNGGAHEFVVLYEQGSSAPAARAAIADAGGKVVDENAAVGVATVRSDDPSFAAKAGGEAALVGAAENRAIGQAPKLRPKADVEREGRAATATAKRDAAAVPEGDPLSAQQWDMQMIGATPDGSYAIEQGSPDVRVGIIDTGIDGSHPDLAPNLDRELSRNFTQDIPSIDGPCEAEPDGSCLDAADVDEGGHGTHVAGTVGAALNGVGIAGVAPKTKLVNLRAGQDSGFFFLGPTVNALTYAGDHGIDVVNMSFFIDPWLYNCAANPADTPEQQQEQQIIIEATNRALRYARARNVTLIAALGNDHSDYDNHTIDTTSPDIQPGFIPQPPDFAPERPVDNSCLDLPTEGPGVISVSALGPSKTKADYSNWGNEDTSVSAPGGYFRDFFGTERYMTDANLVLSSYSKAAGIEFGEIDPETGEPLPDTGVIRVDDAYYAYFQGTSMAAPHATGVAALIIARRGLPDRDNPGLRYGPGQVQRHLERGATQTPCPEPNPLDYPDRGPEYTATCEGDEEANSFYGHGIVSAVNLPSARER